MSVGFVACEFDYIILNAVNILVTVIVTKKFSDQFVIIFYSFWKKVYFITICILK